MRAASGRAASEGRCCHWTPSMTGYPSTARSEARSGRDDHLADDLAVLEDAQRFLRLLERQRAVDGHGQAARAHHLEQLVDVLARPAVGPQHLQLEGPDEADVLLRVEARRGAAREEPATALEAAHRL